jgi:hydroxymethylpyrimidine pyrophosphatase-like HAD family hydrolase
MKIVKPRLIALDIDGTILDRPAGIPVPEAVRVAVADARRSGARVCLCSSRPCYVMEDAVSALGEIDALIGCGGAVIVDMAAAPVCGDIPMPTSSVCVNGPMPTASVCGNSPMPTAFAISGSVAIAGRSVAIADRSVAIADRSVNPAAPARTPFYAEALPAPLLSACLETAKTLGAFATFATSCRVLVQRKGAVGEPKEATGDTPLVVMDEPELLRAFAAEPFFCAYLFTEPGTPAAAVLAAPVLASASIFCSSKNCFIVTNVGTDKGSGLWRLANYFGIPAAAILAVGNDANDVPMLKIAGISVAVKNASPDALAAANHIVGDVAHAGAAEAIRRFAL